ncbi:MAG: glycoside hydrolase, partial [Steroidobacteraceae bacterium]
MVFASVWQVRYRPWLNYFTPDTGPESGVYKSNDGGMSWSRVAGGGWPSGALGRIGLAASHRPEGTRVWALVDAESGGGLYRSDDAGASWQHVNSDAELINSYFARVTAAPNDPDVVYAMGRGIHRCADGGTQCVIVKGGPGGDDYHYLWIDPQQPERMITAADQGAVVTVNGGRTWSSWYNQPTGQFYKLSADNAFPYRIYGGQQDSGTARVASRSDYGSITFRDWEPVGADERDYQIADPRDPEIVYGSGLGGRLSMWNSRNGEVQNISPWPISSYGERPTAFQQHFSWITPIAMSQLAPYPLYFGSQRLWRTVDRGAHWQVVSPDLSARSDKARNCDGRLDPPRARNCGYGTIWSIGLSPRDNAEIWIGTDDGLVRLTRNGGESWTDVTPPGIPAWAKVSTVEPSATQPGFAYIAVDNHRQDDFQPRIFRTRDYGATWSLAVGDLPAGHFVSVVRPDPVRAGLLYAGTETGVFVSLDDGDHWRSLQRNLPTAWVRDLLVQGDDLIAATQGRAIWVLDDLAPLRQFDPLAAAADAHLFTPAAAMRLRKNQNRDMPLPREEPAGKNPPTGAVIDYWLTASARSVELEIRDAAGALVRRFASDAAELKPPAGRYFSADWLLQAEALPNSAGMHRFVWNLRYPRPLAMEYEYSISTAFGAGVEIKPEGLLAAPGAYRVVLRVDGRELSAPLTVRADPRVAVDPAELAQVQDLSREAQQLLSRHFAGAAGLEFVRGRITELQGSQAGKRGVQAALATLDRRASAFEGESGDLPGNTNLKSI